MPRLPALSASTSLPLPRLAQSFLPRRTPGLRPFSTSVPHLQTAKPSVPIALIAELRRQRAVPLALAREALQSSPSHSISDALAYLDQTSASQARKAEKISSRSINEGTIAISLLNGKRAGMIQLGCETDFVSRNDVFLGTARGIAGTVAFLDVPGHEQKPPGVGEDPILSFPVDTLLSAPLISLPSSGSGGSHPLPSSDPITIQQSLLGALSATGENLKILRAVSFAAPFPSSPTIRFIPSAFAHGERDSLSGRVGALVVLSATSVDNERPISAMVHGPGGEELEQALSKLARDVARQVVGFPTKVVSRGKGGGVEDGEVLLEQPFMMKGEERKVSEVMKEWGEERGLKLTVVGMRRWSVGDDLGGREARETEDGA